MDNDQNNNFEENTLDQHQLQNTPYWNGISTTIFSVVVFVIFSVIQGFILLLPQLEDYIAGKITDMSSLLHGDRLAIAELPAAFIGIVLIIFLIKIRKTLSISDYLKVKPVSLMSVLKWFGIMILVLIALEAFGRIFDRETPEFMTSIFDNSSNKFLLFLAVAVAAPLFEEILFRGFFFEGLKHSVVGPIGATVITSGIFAVIHIQYEWVEILNIFFIGLLFGYAKHQSGSLYIPILLHAMMNSAALALLFFK